MLNDLGTVVSTGLYYIDTFIWYSITIMSKIHIIPSEFNEELELQLAYSIKAGFPSPAEDYQEDNNIGNNRYGV